MPDASDILKYPDAELAEALRLSEEGDDLAACSAFRAIHRHLLAGGSLPAQWREEGTAVGALVVDAHSNTRIFEGYAKTPKLAGLAEAANMTRAAIRAVTGEG